MCGISAIISDKNIIYDLYESIYHLQHRGQDGFGISYLNNNKINLCKYKGLLSTVDITKDYKEPKEVLSKIESNIHIVSIDSDYYFTLDRDIYTYNLIKSVKQNVYHHIIQSVHGHDGFLIENEKMSKILSKILIESKNGNNTRKSKQRLSI